jgi:hypothetical protein
LHQPVNGGGKKRRKTPEFSGLCRCGNLHHVRNSGNTSDK